MQITLNGEAQTLDNVSTVSELLARFELAPQRVAVEINEQLVKRALFDATPVREGDRVEIVTLVGGG